MTAMPGALKVLHILGALRPSGMERMFVSGREHFEKANVANVIVGQGFEHPYAESLRSAGYEVHTVRSVGRSWADAWALRRLVRGLGVDVIHIHTEGNYLRTVLAARLALGWTGKIVRTVHSIFASTGAWHFRRRLQAAIGDRFVSCLVAPSVDVASNEEGIGRRVKVIHNWVDDRFFDIRDDRLSRIRPEGDVPIGVIVGNCSDVKHHDLALEAVTSTNHRLIHLGEEVGASAEELALLAELQRNGRLVSRGAHAPDDALRLADYFMMPSRYEGMGVALAEALVVGLPALINDVPGLRWASGISGVKTLEEDLSAWVLALGEWDQVGVGTHLIEIDLSASRGVREYVDLYSSITSHPSRISQRG